MKKQKFEIEGIEMLQREVSHYHGTASRVLVPASWKKVILVRVE